MIRLNSTTDNLQVVLAGNITTNQLQCTSFWRDVQPAASPPTVVDGRTQVSTNNTTDVNVVPAPAGSTYRVCDYVSIYNADTVSATVTVKLDLNATETILLKVTLLTLERLEYTNANGWQTYTTAGALKNNGATTARYRLIRKVVLTGSGTHTPTAGCDYIEAEGVGGGGAGGGCIQAATNAAGGGGGGAGAYVRVGTASVAASYAYVAGGGGTGASGADGGAGTDTTFGSILTAKAGAGGKVDTVTTVHVGGLGGAGGLASGCTGDLKCDGACGIAGMTFAAAQGYGGKGGDSYFGGGANGSKNATANGSAAGQYGGGGGASSIISGGAATTGGNGAAGVIFVTEWMSA